MCFPSFDILSCLSPSILSSFTPLRALALSLIRSLTGCASASTRHVTLSITCFLATNFTTDLGTVEQRRKLARNRLGPSGQPCPHNNTPLLKKDALSCFKCNNFGQELCERQVAFCLMVSLVFACFIQFLIAKSVSKMQ